MKTFLTIAALLMAGLAFAQTIPTTQTAWWDENGQHNAVFQLDPLAGGTYKFQFIENQPQWEYLFRVGFYDVTNGFEAYYEDFTETSPACSGASTVTLIGGRKYRMSIDIAIGNPGQHLDEGPVGTAKIFYECSGN